MRWFVLAFVMLAFSGCIASEEVRPDEESGEVVGTGGESQAPSTSGGSTAGAAPSGEDVAAREAQVLLDEWVELRGEAFEALVSVPEDGKVELSLSVDLRAGGAIEIRLGDCGVNETTVGAGLGRFVVEGTCKGVAAGEYALSVATTGVLDGQMVATYVPA